MTYGRKGGARKAPAKPKTGAVWLNKTQNGTVLKIRLTAEELPEADEKGVIHLVGFKNNYKEGDRDPDFNVRPDEPKKEAAPKAPAGRRREEEESDDDEGFDI